eukprot:GHVS01014090.1.p1 GENE.GHVS01014090.1~~GHVS01014090.1.p1  ORF type:complete len:208 (+),score=29.31 GHVS01014090.1:227-850(+)
MASSSFRLFLLPAAPLFLPFLFLLALVSLFPLLTSCAPLLPLRRLSELPATGRTREQVIARVTEQIPLLYYKEMPWELFTEDVVYANPYVKVPTKPKFYAMMVMIRSAILTTHSKAELIFKNVEFIEPFKLRIDWVTTVCSPLVGMCVNLEGFDIEEYNEDLYCYSHTENWLTPLPAFLFPFKTLTFQFNDIAGIVSSPTRDAADIA